VGKPQNQPLQKGGYALLFNGEIYNYRELIVSYSLDAYDEAEVLLALFMEVGSSFVERVRGMFAIAIYNVQTKELWLFRDLLGKKPLYYRICGKSFLFASELKSLEALCGFGLDKRALHQFLGYGATIAPKTLQRDIFKLPPATMLYYCNGETRLASYDEILDSKVTIESESRASKELEQVLKESVAMRIPKEVEWGVLLSGGLDSSLVAAMAAKQHTKPINTFSIGYEGFEKYDERPFAKELSEHIGSNHYAFNFSKEDFFATLDELLEFIDDPIGDPAQIPLYFLIKKAKEQGVKVLLSGDGSDELFLGYRTYKEYLMMESVKSLPYANWLKNHLRSNFSMNKEWEWYKRALSGDTIFRSSCEIYTDRQLNMLLRLQERDNKNFEALQEYWERFVKSQRDIIDWYSYCDLKVQLAEFFLVKVDRVSMANGVEVRTPFLDKQMLELIFSIDPKIRLNTQVPKSILKEVASGCLPESISNRKKKGLNYPFLEWILEEGGVEKIYEANDIFRIFKRDHLDFLSQKSKSGKFKQHLFPLYMLSLWLLKKGNT
ncbi:MAG TPA: asparagine synthase (glutamine-hydrolyzing), partial [Nitratifractor sp.]|nr:asparagine synthase (glutamine-hydrolyzing) [Nitratifractor sp.]